MTPAWLSVATALAAVLALGAGCTGEDDPDRRPGAPAVLAQAACPADVADSVVGEVDCARLTVPENRSLPEGRTVELLVTTVRAPEGSPEREPMLVPGSFRQPNYAGIAGLAQRVGRDVILVDTRGAGHSTPSLACPEVAATAPGAWMGGPRATRLITAAVLACHDRLEADGVDVGAYDLTNTAADLEDLRRALGLDRWNLITYGPESRVALELVRLSPTSVRTLVLDSPDVPGTDPRAIAGPATQNAIHRVLAACAADRACYERYPDPASLIHRAMKALRQPLRLRVPDDGETTPLVFDQGFLARALRQMLSDGGSSGALFTPASVPALLDAVAVRNRSRLADAAGDFIRYEGPLCLGYRTPCLPAITGSLGVELTMLCRDIAPFTDHRPSGLGPGFRQAFGRSPWWRLCDAWPVTAADPAVARPPVADVPTLVALGRFAPYSPGPVVRRGLTGLTHASYVVVAGRSHNVLPQPCVGDVRDRWVDDPLPLSSNPCPRQEQISWN